MVKLFSKNMVLQAVLILAALVLLWMPALLNPQPMPEGDGILFEMLRSVMLPKLAIVIAMVLVLIEGVLLNLLLANAGIVPQTTLLPTLLYIIAASATAHSLIPALLTNLVLIGCIHPLILHGTLLTIPTSKICNATALIGIASLISLPAAGFMLTYLLVAANYRLYGWRDWVAMLLGFLAPYILLVSVLMLTGDLAAWWSQSMETLGDIGIRIGETSALKLSSNIVLLLVMLVALFALWGQLGEKTVVWQKNASTIMLFTIGGIIMLLYTQALPADTTYFAIPFALCGCHLLLPQRTGLYSGKKRKHAWIYDVILIITLIAAVIC